MSINLNNFSILNICTVDYCCIINGKYGISKSEATNLLQITDLSEKSGTLQNITFLCNVSKMETITFSDIGIEKHKFHHYKDSIS